MDLDHDQQARLVCDEILKKWKSGDKDWKNKFIDPDIHYVAGQLNFPSPDKSFYSKKTKSRIAIEFKPIKNDKDDVVRGLGQTLTYLNNDLNSASYLVCAEKTPQNFPIGSFIEKLFKKVIYERIPVGFITFDHKNISKIKIRCNVSNNFNIKKVVDRGVDRSYWADYRDSYIEANYYLLKISNEIPYDRSDRYKLIWDKFYDDYFCATKASKTLELVKSKIRDENGNYQIPLKDTKIRLKKQIEEKKISLKQALDQLSDQVSKTGYDNHYQDLKKNHKNFVSHLRLWDDDTKIPTSIGLRFLKRVKNKINIVDELSKIVLVAGRHKELIDTVNNFFKEETKKFGSENERRLALRNHFSNKGYVKFNPKRAKNKSRMYLQSEFQLWYKLGFKKKFANNSKHYDENQGYGFNIGKIQRLVKSYLAEYPRE